MMMMMMIRMTMMVVMVMISQFSLTEKVSYPDDNLVKSLLENL